VALLDSFLRVVVDQRASDLHLHAGKPPTVRLDGELVPLPFRHLSDVEARRFVLEVLSPAQQARLECDQQLDFVYVLPGVARFRANAFMQRDGLSAVLRVIPAHIPSLDELLLPGALRELTRLQNGLVLVTGPTGSGKTTTLAAMLREIDATSRRHVITLEDPVEFVHRPTRGLITQREVGTEVESFAAGLRSALRESPDVLMLGELRDQETVSLALQAAETGVLVLGTLHTNSASAAVDRIVDVVPEASREQARSVLSVLLRGVVAQQLCRRSVGEGRVAALEIMLQNHAISNLVRENKTHQIDGYLQSASNDGTGAQSMDHCLLRLVRDGVIDTSEALRVANGPELLRDRIAELPAES